MADKINPELIVIKGFGSLGKPGLTPPNRPTASTSIPTSSPPPSNNNGGQGDEKK